VAIVATICEIVIGVQQRKTPLWIRLQS